MFASHSTDNARAAEPKNHGGDATVRQAVAETSRVWEALALHPNGLQRKLAIGQSDDPHEQEASRVADMVMRAAVPDSPVAEFSINPSAKAQRKCADCDEEEKQVQRSVSPHSSAGESTDSSVVDQALSSGGQPLDRETRAFFEPRFRYDFSDVRLHSDGPAADSASALNARAYTLGRHVVLGAGESHQESESGRHLLAHELAHVVQQTGSVGKKTIQRQEGSPPRPRPRLPLSGDRERLSPADGVPIRSGTLRWDLHYEGWQSSEAITGTQITVLTPIDVRFNISFTPTAGTRCPTITFIQIVRSTIAGMHVQPHLLFIQDAGGFAADTQVDRTTGSVSATEPFYGAEPQASGPGLGPEQNSAVAGSAPGRSAAASYQDGPDWPTESIPPGTTMTREFEAAAICVETGETFGSLRWGYTKASNGTITLTGAQLSDVQTTAARAQLESARRAFYSGFFQESLSGFARGSATLTRQHRDALRAVAGIGLVRRIVLVGANDFSGGPENNAALSLRRAEAAQQFLVNDLHVDPSIIRVEGHGVEAREPNAPGANVPANRRVDIHLERGMVPTGPPEAPGSAMEELRLRHRDPHLIFQQLIDSILELQRTTGPVAPERCRQLGAMMWALNRWRQLDERVPSVGPYTEAVNAIRRRCPSEIPRELPRFERPPLQPPSLVPRIREPTGSEPF